MVYVFNINSPYSHIGNDIVETDHGNLSWPSLVARGLRPPEDIEVLTEFMSGKIRRALTKTMLIEVGHFEPPADMLPVELRPRLIGKPRRRSFLKLLDGGKGEDD